MKEYNNRFEKPLINPAVLNGDVKKDEKTCKECGVALPDPEVDTCYACYVENHRRGNQ